MTAQYSEAELRTIYERVHPAGTYGADFAPGTPWAEADTGARRPPLRVMTAQEYLAQEFPPEESIVDGLVPKVGLGLILGAEKTGKSFFALQLALCVGAGVPFLGRAVRQTPVLIIEEEGSRAGYQRRLRKLTDALGLDLASLQTNLLVRQQVHLDDAAILAEIEGVIVDRKIGLVIVGPLSQVAEIEDENKSGEMNALVRLLNPVVGRHELMLMLVHHRRKAGNGQGAPTSVNGMFETARGSNALVAAIDTGLGIWREQEKSTTRLLVLQRDSESFREALEFDSTTGLFAVSDEPVDPPTVDAATVLELLRDKGVLIPGVAAGLLKKSRNTAQKLLDDLVREDKATMTLGDHGRHEYRPTESGTVAIS